MSLLRGHWLTGDAGWAARPMTVAECRSDGAPAGPGLPTDVYASLVNSLYGEARSLFIGAFAASAGALLTAYKTGEWPLLLCAAAIVIVATLRVLDMRRYARLGSTATQPSEIRRWELRYAAGAGLYVALLGFFCLAAFILTDDPFAHLISFGTVIAYLIGVSGRNFASRTLVISQTLCAGIPVGIGLLVMGGYYPAIVLLVLIPLMVALTFISERLRLTFLDAVMTAREMSLLAKQFDTALENMPHGLLMFNPEGRLTVRNSRALEIFQLTPEQLPTGVGVKELFHICSEVGVITEGDVEKLVPRNGRGPKLLREQVVDTTSGRTVSLSFQGMEEGGWVTNIQDITERRVAEKKIERLASYDTLTQLPNRHGLRAEIRKLARGGAGNIAILFLDLDSFKQVNDTLGHRFGDELLCRVAERLKRIAGPSMKLARFGGDEFIVLIPDTDASGATMVAEQIIEGLSHPYELEDHTVIAGASVGIAMGDQASMDADQLLRDADTALYEAKAEGRGRWCTFRPELAAKAQHRRLTEFDLRSAVARGGFELAFQPLYDVQKNRFSTCEALLRWPHPQRGMISPAEFIPIAEETGLIVPIGRWVLTQACLECLTWPDHVRVAVNLSSVQFQLDDIAAAVGEALAKSGLDPSRLEIEVTESVLLKDEKATFAALAQLRRLGLHISLDDFGTGYSSLSYLRTFSFDKVKIDQSFSQNITTDATSRILLRGIAQLSSQLGMRVAVEGVESEEQLRLLSTVPGVDEIQGYYFSRPVSSTAVCERLHAEEPTLPQAWKAVS